MIRRHESQLFKGSDKSYSGSVFAALILLDIFNNLNVDLAKIIKKNKL